MKRSLTIGGIALALGACAPESTPQPAPEAPPATNMIEVELERVTPLGPGESLGIATLAESAEGVLIRIALAGLTPGPHGFHVHENGSCAPEDGEPAGAAGPHFDPTDSGTHQGPQGQGHLGDLPRLQADAEGRARAEFVAARIASLQTLRGRTLIVHAEGDSYADVPPNGGAGARVACGVII